MTSHADLILSSDGQNPLQRIISDTKSFTSRHIRKLLKDKNAVGESRREWKYGMMKEAGIHNSNNHDFQFWQQHNQPIVLDSNELIDQKVNYIHNNPVEAGFVAEPEDWLYGSAVDFTLSGKGLMKLATF